MPPPTAAPALVAKIKVQLKLSIARLRMIQKRDEALAKAQRRAMAQLLEAGKIDSARIRVENIIRSDIISELHEMLELYCELLLARAGLLEASPTCDPGLEEAVKSIMYAAPKLPDIKELQQVRGLLADKFGKEFVAQAMENADGKVADGVVRRLKVAPPKEELVQGYLEEIARAYGVNWPKRKQELGDPPDLLGGVGGGDGEGGEGGGGEAVPPLLGEDGEEVGADGDKVEKRVELIKATPPKSFGPGSPLHVNPPSPSTDNIHPKVTLGSVELTPVKKPAAGVKPAAKKGGGGIADGVPDVDELAKRFAALKR